ncbi:MAG TPA: ELM1/GtrOC1 family putative glycosyltransferase [Myxococcota bacterium]|nr:ELM1/GtrOC1 family putative glycosyltransferase [Myxococcota bacterium]
MTPRVWLVLGDKRGDNAQVEVLADALGWPYERRHIALKDEWVFGKPKVEASLHHLDADRSDPLEPPWPDLVLTIGRRPSMAALWVKAQSGGRTRVVLVGKPAGRLELFDLVIASAEAQLPPAPSVYKTTLPLMRVAEKQVAQAAEAWRERFAALPRPLIAFLIGGPTSPFVYDTSWLHRLVDQARKVVAQGGTPYFTTSRRTPPAFVDELKRSLPPGTPLFRFAPDAADNPYRALLGLADGFVVTGDSISMMVEVIRLRRPLAILPVPARGLGRLDLRRRALARWLFSPGEGAAARLRRALGHALFRSRVMSQTRDFPAFHRMLVARGLAVFAGEPFRAPTGAVPDDLADAAARVRALAAGLSPS